MAKWHPFKKDADRAVKYWEKKNARSRKREIKQLQKQKAQNKNHVVANSLIK